MNFGFFGIIDIIIVFFAVVFLILGYKKGFMDKALSIFGFVVIAIFCFVYCGQFSQFLIHNNIIYPSINGHITGNINAYMVENGVETLTASDVLSKALKIPGFISDIIAGALGNPEPAQVVTEVANYLSTMIMNVISFCILVVGLFLILAILKLIAHLLTKNKIIKIADGILGVVLYFTIYSIVLSVVFYVLSLMMDQTWFSAAREWLAVDMQLDNPDAFRISKAIYEGNILKAFLDLIF